MKNLTTKETTVVLVTATILFFSGKHLLSTEGIKNLLDIIMVLLFFLTLLPFVINSVKLLYKLIKTILNFIAI